MGYDSLNSAENNIDDGRKMKMKSILLLSMAMMLIAASSTHAKEKKIDVNLDNLRTVESQIQFDRYQKVAGGVNKLHHLRTPVDIDNQTTIAMNRDTLYSLAVVNLKEPVTIVIPENNGRYLTVEVIDEDHYAYEVFTKPGKYSFSENDVGTRYAVLAIRVFVNPDDPDDVAAAHALQDAFAIEGGYHEPLVLPDYDMARYQTLFKMVQQLVNFAGKDTIGSMGKRGEVDTLKHTVATIAGWGLLPPERAMYQAVQLNLSTAKKYKIQVPTDVPVGAFWSISMYNAKGFFQKNDLGVYSLNSVTAKRNADNSVTIHLGGCEDGRSNCLPFAGEGFYYQWRMYEPGEAFLKGEYAFNLPEEVE
jgi:hypothetical protein